METSIKAILKNEISPEDCQAFHSVNPIISFKYFGFIIIAILNHVEHLSRHGVENLLLKNKIKSCIGRLVTQHKGLNGGHDWNKGHRIHKNKHFLNL